MRLVLRVFALATPVLGVAAMSVRAQQRSDAADVRQQFVGSYKLISYMGYDQNGTPTKLPYAASQINLPKTGVDVSLCVEGRSGSEKRPYGNRPDGMRQQVSNPGYLPLDLDKRQVEPRNAAHRPGAHDRVEAIILNRESHLGGQLDRRVRTEYGPDLIT